MRKAIIDKLVELEACEDAIEWCKGYASKQKAWDACYKPGWMCWLLDEWLDGLAGGRGWGKGCDKVDNCWHAFSKRKNHRARCNIIRKHFPSPPRIRV